MTDAIYEACARDMHVVTRDGQVLRGGVASLFILRRLGFNRVLVAALGVPPLSWCVRLGYRLVADNRQFFSRILFRRRPADPPC